MKKLFVNDEYKGMIRHVCHDSVAGMWIFRLSESEFSAIALRDDEIFGFGSSSYSDDINIITMDPVIPDGEDAECYGEKIVNA